MSDVLLTVLLVAMAVIIGLLLLTLWRLRSGRSEADQLVEFDRVIGQLKEAFGSLSRDALSANSEDFLKLAGTRLDQEKSKVEQSLEAKKKVIDANLDALRHKMGELNSAIVSIEKERRESHGRLAAQLQNASEVTSKLEATTSQLHEVLASPQSRGQWGERMAEDMLQLVGLVEGVNYDRQKQDSTGGRPDFTFYLPRGLRLNMDVKFPLANFAKYVLSSHDGECDEHKKKFLRDVRNRIKGVTTREYVDPASGTLDYVLVFIPIESAYGFIHQEDPELMDYALKNKVVLCSPFSLYAILAVIRQSVENFQLERASNDILELLIGFRKQWEKYIQAVDRLGKKLYDATKAYEEMSTTRTRSLDRQLDKIDGLQRRHLPVEKTDPQLLPGADEAVD